MKYVILEGIEYGNKFFSPYTEGEDPTLSTKGERWYKILRYAETIRDAQMFLYGWSDTKSEV